MEELQRKREETARALKAVSAKSQELEARMHHLSASASSSEQELRSEAAEVPACSRCGCAWLCLRTALSSIPAISQGTPGPQPRVSLGCSRH